MVVVPFAKPDPTWTDRLARTAHNAVQPSLANALLILEHDPPLAGMFGYNAFTYQSLLLRAPPIMDEGQTALAGPYPRVWEAPDVSLVQAYLQRERSQRFGRDVTEQAMLTIAAQHTFHPVRDWLSGLKWDGMARIDVWLQKTFRCEDNEYHRAVGARFLIAAVRRVKYPGCQFDHMPILEGAQGIGKSSALRGLFGEGWFADWIPADLAGKEAAQVLRGVWGLELAEIDALIRSEVESVKAFVSRRVDRYRPPYGRAVMSYERQGVLVGTTNSNDYLRDHTGNRRFWPVACKTAEPEWVLEHREQLWAEAVAREASGEAIWLHEKEITDIAREYQDNRTLDDAWLQPVSAALEFRSAVTLPELLSDTLGIPRHQQDRRSVIRVANILYNLGYRRAVIRDGNLLKRMWKKTELSTP